MKIRRIAGFAASVAVGALVLTACSSTPSSTSSTGSGGKSTGVITDWSSEPQNPLIPTNTSEVGGAKVLENLFAGLEYYDAKGAPKNEVADSITTKDAQTYTIKLKSGWKFTNGEAVTSKSFVDAWNYGATTLPNVPQQLLNSFFQPIEGYSDVTVPDPADSTKFLAPTAKTMSGLVVVDDTTFTVKLAKAESDFPLQLGYSAFYPLPQAAYKDMAAFGENPIGDGPYKFAKKGAWQHNVAIDVVPNADYAGDRVAQNGGVSFKFYATLDAAYNDLLADQLDVLDSIPDSAYGTFQKELGNRAVNTPSAIFQSFTIPQALAHFSGAEGKLRRQAISLAVNRTEITKTIFRGTRTPARDFTSPVIAGWSDSIPGNDVLTFDAAKAKDLWKQADAISPWSGTFTIGYNTDGGHQAWVDAVTNSLKNTLGISAEGNPVATFGDFRTQITGRTIKGAFRSGWQADYPGLYDFLGPLYGTGAGSNDGVYSNPQVDSLLKEGLAAMSIADANKKFDSVQEILFKDLPAIPLWYQNVTAGSSTLVSNVQFGWDSFPLLYKVTKKG